MRFSSKGTEYLKPTVCTFGATPWALNIPFLWNFPTNKLTEYPERWQATRRALGKSHCLTLLNLTPMPHPGVKICAVWREIGL